MAEGSPRKQVVEAYIEGFRTGDRDLVLSLLTDDITWQMAGFFDLEGKEAFGNEMQNDAAEGLPTFTTPRLVEEDDVVVCIGTVRCAMKGDWLLDAVFADVFYFEGDKIRRLETYQMFKTPPPPMG